MKLSKYNFRLSIKDKTYIYNSVSNSLIELNVNQADYIEGGLAKPGLLYGDDYKEFDNQLLKYKIICDDEDEINNFHLDTIACRFDSSILYLTIAPTQECNFNCVYCYEKTRTSVYMDEEIEDSIIQYIKQVNPKKVVLVWFGGEPLLAVDTICSFHTKISKLSFQLEASIITNGFLLSKEIFLRLLDCNISQFQITLDGDEKSHNDRRPLLNGSNTYQTIISNLQQVLNYCSIEKVINVKFHIRVNIDRSNFSKFLDVRKEFLIHESSLLCIHPALTKATDCYGCNCFSINEYVDFCLELLKKNGIKTIDLYPSNKITECFARHINSYLIGPDGSLFKCWHDLGNSEMCIGNIKDRVIKNPSIVSRYIIATDPYFDSNCRKCSFLPICGGGCPNERYLNLYISQNNNTCTIFKHRLKELITAHLELKEKSDKF